MFGDYCKKMSYQRILHITEAEVFKYIYINKKDMLS